MSSGSKPPYRGGEPSRRELVGFTLLFATLLSKILAFRDPCELIFLLPLFDQIRLHHLENLAIAGL